MSWMIWYGSWLNKSKYPENKVTEAAFYAGYRAGQYDEGQAKQAEIDRLMLDSCPDEMTEDQMENWSKHQSVKIE
jgi:hypothetical protein